MQRFSLKEMPEFIDTHTHLYLDEFEKDWKEVIQRSIEQGVRRMYLPNLDSSSVDPMMKLCEAFPENCFPMMGLHPTSVKMNYKEELDLVEKNLRANQYAAIGEIGIDLYWTHALQKEQTDAFRRQLELAKELDLPVVIHARDSFKEIFAVLDKVADDRLKGVFHSFTGSFFLAQEALKYGFLIGINGIVTFKNSGLDKVVAGIDPDDILIETDAPFLAPNPYRGKRNESSYVIKVAQKLAEIYALELDEIAELTTRNALNLFKLS